MTAKTNCRKLLSAACALAMSLLLAACARPGASRSAFVIPTVDPNAPVVIERVVNEPEVKRVTAHLESRGFKLEAAGQSLLGLLADALGQTYRLNDGWLHLHLYDRASTAEAAAHRISAMWDSAMTDWVARPSFFRCGRVIVAYLGMEQAVLNAIQDLCGPPFAQLQINTTPQPTAPPFTSVEIAIGSLASRQNMASVKLIGAPTIHLTQTLSSGIAVLYRYAALSAGQPMTVTRITYLDWRDPVWYPDCDNMVLTDLQRGARPSVPVQLVFATCVVNGGTDTAAKPDQVSFVGGEINEPAIERITVAFADGSLEQAVRDATFYLAVKLDAGEPIAVYGFDQQGNQLFKQHIPRQ